jgi:hypothetical protein
MEGKTKNLRMRSRIVADAEDFGKRPVCPPVISVIPAIGADEVSRFDA